MPAQPFLQIFEVWPAAQHKRCLLISWACVCACVLVRRVTGEEKEARSFDAASNWTHLDPKMRLLIPPLPPVPSSQMHLPQRAARPLFLSPARSFPPPPAPPVHHHPAQPDPAQFQPPLHRFPTPPANFHLLLTTASSVVESSSNPPVIMDYSQHAPFFAGSQQQPFHPQFISMPPLTPSHSNSAGSEDFNNASPSVSSDAPLRRLGPILQESRESQDMTLVFICLFFFYPLSFFYSPELGVQRSNFSAFAPY